MVKKLICRSILIIW